MADYTERLKKYVEEAKKGFATSLEQRIQRLAKEEREEQLYGAEKLQQAGRFTSGFRTDLMTRITDIFAGRRGEVRGEYDERAMTMAQYLLGLATQSEEAQKNRELQRWLAQFSARLGGGGGAGAGGVRVSTPTYTAPTVTPTPTRDTSRSAYDKERADFERRIRKAAEGFVKYEERGMTKQPAYPIKGISPTYAPYRVDKSKPVYY